MTADNTESNIFNDLVFARDSRTQVEKAAAVIQQLTNDDSEFSLEHPTRGLFVTFLYRLHGRLEQLPQDVQKLRAPDEFSAEQVKTLMAEQQTLHHAVQVLIEAGTLARPESDIYDAYTSADFKHQLSGVMEGYAEWAQKRLPALTKAGDILEFLGNELGITQLAVKQAPAAPRFSTVSAPKIT